MIVRYVATAAITASVLACSLVRNTSDLGPGAEVDDTKLEPPNEEEGDGSNTQNTPDNDSGTKPAGSPCATAHLVCDDFDKEPFGDGWTEKEQSAGAVTRDTTVFRSGSSSLRASMNTNPGEDTGAYWGRKINLTKQSVEASADLRITRTATSLDQLDYFLVYLNPAPADREGHGVGIVERADGMHFEYFEERENQDDLAERFPIALPSNEWHNFKIKITFEGTPKATLFIDDKEAGSINIKPGDGALGSAYVEVGLATIDNADGTQHVVNVDNVVVD